MKQLKGFFIDGPHEGRFISIIQYFETVEMQFDETCKRMNYTDEDIRKGTYVQYNRLGVDDDVVYYILAEQPTKD